LPFSFYFKGPIERQNVQLAQAVFHDSTFNALKFYGDRGNPSFLATAKFIEIISRWWKLVNVKSKFHSLRKRDGDREPITKNNLVEKTSFLRGFVDWLSAWEDCTQKTKNGLSRETFLCSKHTSASLAALSEFLVNEKNFDYFLTGKAQSDKIEHRFGKSRQMFGGNLYGSVRQFLESDRTLRIKNLAKLNLSMARIKDIFSDSVLEQTEQEEKISEEIFKALDSGETIELSPPISEAVVNILFYIAGYFSRSLCHRCKCPSCKELLSPSDSFESFVVVNDTEENESLENQVVSDYLSQINRGGLTVPSELAFLTCVQAWKFYSKIMENPILKSLLHSANISSRKVFQTAFVKYLESCEETRHVFLLHSCDKMHIFKQYVVTIAGKIFNLFSKNLVSLLNSEIHSKKGRQSKEKRDPLRVKVAKLQSGTIDLSI
jgi:hypothetical protein